MFRWTAAAFKLAPIKSATNLQFSSGLFVNAKKVQFVLVKVPINRDKTAPAPDLIPGPFKLGSLMLVKRDGAGCRSQDPPLPSNISSWSSQLTQKWLGGYF